MTSITSRFPLFGHIDRITTGEHVMANIRKMKLSKAFLTRIVNNDPENAVERSALSTCIAILGRTAIYAGREATWKGDIGIATA